MSANAESSDLKRLVFELKQGRWWIVASVALCTALFVTAALVMRPVYRATILLVPTGGEHGGVGGLLNSAVGQLGGIGALIGIGANSGDAATEEALAVLKSRQFTQHFIADFKLLPILFPKLWDAPNQRWRADVHAPTDARAYAMFSRLRTVTQDKKTGLVTVQVDWRDRFQATEWANQMAARLNAEMRERAIAQARESIGFLERELASTSTIETRDAINRLIEAQIKQRMLANVTEEYAFRIVDRATVPDGDDPVRPQKFLLFLLGPFVGIACGIVAVLMFNRIANWRE